MSSVLISKGDIVRYKNGWLFKSKVATSKVKAVLGEKIYLEGMKVYTAAFRLELCREKH